MVVDEDDVVVVGGKFFVFARGSLSVLSQVEVGLSVDYYNSRSCNKQVLLGVLTLFLFIIRDITLPL